MQSKQWFRKQFAVSDLMLLWVVSIGSAFAAPSFSTSVVCSASHLTVGGIGYESCKGPFAGYINGSPSELTTLATLFPLPPSAWTWEGKSDDTGFGPFTSGSNATSGNLYFDSAAIASMDDMPFVVGIKGGPDYSFYYFAKINTTGMTTLALHFDTLGVYTGNGSPGLSHAALYIDPPVTAVPEPETYVMLLAGLGLMGFVTRRRRQSAAA